MKAEVALKNFGGNAHIDSLAWQGDRAALFLRFDDHTAAPLAIVLYGVLSLIHSNHTTRISSAELTAPGEFGTQVLEDLQSTFDSEGTYLELLLMSDTGVLCRAVAAHVEAALYPTLSLVQEEKCWPHPRIPLSYETADGWNAQQRLRLHRAQVTVGTLSEQVESFFETVTIAPITEVVALSSPALLSAVREVLSLYPSSEVEWKELSDDLLRRQPLARGNLTEHTKELVYQLRSTLA